MKKVGRFLNLILSCLIVISTFSFTFGAGVLENMSPNMNALAGSEGLANNIIGALRLVGYFIAVGIIVFIGVKYIMASADEKADLKSALPKYFVGAILIIFAVEIIGFVFTVVNGGAA